MFDETEFDGHEEVVAVSDAATGLRAVIAIHSTVLGPGLGGIRCWNYASGRDAVRDALRLSTGMTYKNSLAGLALGGGKSVILGDPGSVKRPDLLRAFARAVHNLDGRYIGAEDVGMSVADIDLMRDETPYLAGTSWGAAASGDPSPFTAEGVFLGMKAAVAARMGRDDMQGVRVGILGLGAVGWKLMQKLATAGATLLVADINAPRAAQAMAEFGATVLTPADLPFAEMDVFAPCALGGALTPDFVAQAPAGIVCGAANNQLAAREVDSALWRAGKLYAPDYLVNAGGVINVAAEASGDYDAYSVNMKVRQIAETARQVFAEAERTDTPTGAVADRLALARIEEARNGTAPLARACGG